MHNSFDRLAGKSTPSAELDEPARFGSEVALF